MFNRDQTASIEVMDKLSGANKIPPVPTRYCKKCGARMKHTLQVINFGFDPDTGKKITRLQLTYSCKKILHSKFEYFHLTDDKFNPWTEGKPTIKTAPVDISRLMQPTPPQPVPSYPQQYQQTYPYYTSNTSNITSNTSNITF